LGGVTIVQKGSKDVISDGVGYIECNEDGSARRCGGQGDVLSGSIATFLSWSYKSQSNQSNQSNQINQSNQNQSSNYSLSPTLLACYASSLLLRTSAKEAFAVHKRGTTTPNIIDKIPNVFEQLWPSSQFIKL
jgi:ATP-dependent NAD(P)H-hydrate dehydratase